MMVSIPTTRMLIDGGGDDDDDDTIAAEKALRCRWERPNLPMTHGVSTTRVIMMMFIIRTCLHAVAPHQAAHQ